MLILKYERNVIQLNFFFDNNLNKNLFDLIFFWGSKVMILLRLYFKI